MTILFMHNANQLSKDKCEEQRQLHKHKCSQHINVVMPQNPNINFHTQMNYWKPWK